MLGQRVHRADHGRVLCLHVVDQAHHRGQRGLQRLVVGRGGLYGDLRRLGRRLAVGGGRWQQVALGRVGHVVQQGAIGDQRDAAALLFSGVRLALLEHLAGLVAPLHDDRRLRYNAHAEQQFLALGILRRVDVLPPLRRPRGGPGGIQLRQRQQAGQRGRIHAPVDHLLAAHGDQRDPLALLAVATKLVDDHAQRAVADVFDVA